jgi:HemY protein
MKQMLVLLVLMLVAGLLLGTWVLSDPGYILIIREGWQLESTLGFALFCSILLLTATAMLTLLLSSVWDVVSPFGATGRWRTYVARQRMDAGFYALVDGQWSKAERLLAAAAKVDAWRVMASLGAAQAAAEQGRDEAVRGYLDFAHDSKRGRLAAGLMAAKLSMDGGYPGEARNMLNVLRDMAPKNPRLLRMLASTLEGVGDWSTLCAMLPQLQKQGMEERAFTALSRRAWHGWLKQAAGTVPVSDEASTTALANTDDVAAQTPTPDPRKEATHKLHALRSIWKMMPSAMQQDAALRAQYAGYLAQFGDGEAALTVVRKDLSESWDDRLPAILECINNVAPERLLSLLERWLEQRPANDVLLLTAGRVAMKAQLWGKARGFFESAGRIGNAVALAELARLYAALGEHGKSLAVLEERLRLLDVSLPDLPMPSSARALAKE